MRARAFGVLTLAGVAALVQCRQPTELTVTLPTDVPCAQLASVMITAAGPADFDTQPPQVNRDASTCTPGNVGSIVLVPSGAKDALIGVKVVVTLSNGTITARRRLRYLPHTPLLLPIKLSASCVDIACDASTTCVDGACVGADIPDPSACASPSGCGEGALGGTDAGADAGPNAVSDGGQDAGPDAPVTPADYHDMTNAAFWSTFDLGAIFDLTPGGYAGGVFDGRYVYLVPSSSGKVVRYDTGAPFDAAASWSTFDTGAAFGTPAMSFLGGEFDGRYVYLVPQASLVVRFDTQAPFDTAASWSTFDVASLSMPIVGFRGGLFDGRYVYLAPTSRLIGSIMKRTPFVRYDSRADFGAVTSWSMLPAPTTGNECEGFMGGTFDGRYVYFAPTPCIGTYVSRFARYDTQGPFSDGASWASAPMTGTGYAGSVFDGRYVHFAPSDNSTPQATATALDTRAPFDSNAFSQFAISSLDPNAIGRFGGAFDGRYVYFMPDATTPLPGYHNGVVARYDAQSSYTARSSWSTFDLTTLTDGGSSYFGGAVFDGRYVYVIPLAAPLVVSRFDAKSPPSLPPGFTGSFL